MKVQCPSCKRRCHKTTDNFNPDTRPNGSMIELINPWKRWWGKSDGYSSADLECPLCGAPLAPAGRLHLVPDDYGVVRVESLAEANQKRIALLFPEENDVWIDEAAPISEEVYEDITPDTAEPTTKAQQIRDLLKTDMTIPKIAERVGTSPQYVRNVAGKVG